MSNSKTLTNSSRAIVNGISEKPFLNTRKLGPDKGWANLLLDAWVLSTKLINSKKVELNF